MVSRFGSLGDTIMGKTADLTVVQKTIIDTLHKERKPQTWITVHRVLYPSMLTESWVQEKDAQPTESITALWGLSSKINSRICVNFTRNGLRLGQDIKSTTHRRVEEFDYSCGQRRLTWAKKKNWTVAQRSKVLFSDESKFSISFGNQGPRVWRKGGEAHSPSCLKSSVKCPQSVMIWGAMSSAGVGPLCFLKTNVNTFWSTSCFLLLISFLKMLMSFSSRIWHLPTLPKAPKVGSMTMVLLCLIGQQTRLTWTS